VKIAIASDGSLVAAHFGRCSEYTIFTVEDGKLLDKITVPNPGHEPGFLPDYLSRLGVRCIIAGGMGTRAQKLFTEKSIQTMTGVFGPVSEAIDSYLAGSLEAGESLCEHGERHQGCDHHGKHEYEQGE